jgi:tRNA-modifying protein YgfZ
VCTGNAATWLAAAGRAGQDLAMAAPFRLDRTLIRVSGADAAGFLDKLLTHNLEQLDHSGVQYAALLSPQGKLVADMLVWADGEGIVVEADPARGPGLLARLKMYKLRAAVGIEDVTGRLQILFAPEVFEGARADPRFPKGELGWRMLCAREAREFPDGAEAYDTQRLALGVPDLARDAAPEEVFALEALLEELNGVDFQKGCFVGQENVSRMKRRATTRKKFCPINFDGPALAPGTPVMAGDAEVGAVRSGVAGRALALLRLDRALGQGLRAGGIEVLLDPPPWLILPHRETGAPD